LTDFSMGAYFFVKPPCGLVCKCNDVKAIDDGVERAKIVRGT